MNFQRFSISALFCAILLSAGLAFAQNSAKPDPERDHAFELYNQGKMVDAMPLLEKLAADNPKDVGVVEAWGVAILSYAETLSDLELRKKARVRARSILLKAEELGDNSDLPKTLLRMIPEDGSAAAFSDKKEVDDAMQQAEADFVRGDLDKARQAYMRAYLLDPRQYYAALFIGDTFFRQHQPAFAGEWFAQAVQIDPNRETAYRYWGDALLSADKKDEARIKFIEAIIADPYNQTSWIGITKWAKSAQVQLNWLRLKDGVAVEVKDSKTNITLDSALAKDDPLTGGWLAYGMSRALWMTEKFGKEYPKEPSYRRSLREEAESLHMLIAVGTEVQKKGHAKEGNQDLTALEKIEKTGLLEPFALLNRADNGIAKDYEGYRAANREKIRKYLDEFVVPKAPAQPASAHK